jgi:predicted TIM-barrel fold metal-dependent hydrolase
MPARDPIIDTDIHNGIDHERVLDFLPEPWRTRYASGNRGPGWVGYWNPNGVFRSDTVIDGIRIEEDPVLLAREYFDVYGIEYGVLNQPGTHLGLSPEPDYAAAMVSAINDVIINDWLPVDDRFLGSILVSQADPQLAAKEIHRLAGHPQMVQVLMGSGARFPMGQRFYDPIYKAAADHGLPVAIHPGNEGNGVGGPSTPAGYPGSYLEWHTNLVSNFIAHLVSLVVEGTFVKFPTLRFVLVEGGVSWLPPILWRLDKNWKGLRQTVPWLERRPSDYVHDHILLTTQPIEEPDKPEHLKAILEMFDASRMLMFSSDYPHWDGDTPDFAARAFPRELRARVMSETARELYGLPAANTSEMAVHASAGDTGASE